MLKNFFMSFLGSIAAIWLSVMILFVLTIVFVAGLIGSSLKSVKIADHSILQLVNTGRRKTFRTSSSTAIRCHHLRGYLALAGIRRHRRPH